MKSSVVWRKVASLYALRLWLKTMRKTYVLRRFPSGPMTRRAGAKIHLAFFPCGTLDPPHGQHPLASQSSHKSFDAVVAPGEAVVAHQILKDALCAQFEIQLRLNDRPIRHALTRPTTQDRSCLLAWVGRVTSGCQRVSEIIIRAWRPGGRNGWFWFRQGGRRIGTFRVGLQSTRNRGESGWFCNSRAGGRNGWFWQQFVRVADAFLPSRDQYPVRGRSAALTNVTLVTEESTL